MSHTSFRGGQYVEYPDNLAKPLTILVDASNGTVFTKKKKNRHSKTYF